jgi:hypothetical protein
MHTTLICSAHFFLIPKLTTTVPTTRKIKMKKRTPTERSTGVELPASAISTDGSTKYRSAFERSIIAGVDDLSETGGLLCKNWTCGDGCAYGRTCVGTKKRAEALTRRSGSTIIAQDQNLSS